MAHLSHIMTMLIESRYLHTFPAENAIYQYASFGREDNSTFASQHFGSIVEELSTTVVDFRRDSVRSDIPPIPKIIGYSINDRPLCFQRTSDDTDNDIMYVIDDQHTCPGYVRIEISVNADKKVSELLRSKMNLSMYHLHPTSKDKTQTIFMGLRSKIWPESAKDWFTRERPAKWPQEEILESAQEDECFLINQSHPHSSYPEAEWQWVFPATEIRIAREALSEEQKYCFRVFKVLVDFHTRNLPVRLTTTHLKTVMYTTCEVLASELWRWNPAGCLLFLLHRLVACLRLGILPNYFISANNMIDHFSKRHLCALRQRLYALRTFPVSALVMLSDHYDICGTGLLNRTLEDINKFRKHQSLGRSFVECFLRNYSLYYRVQILCSQFKNAKKSLEEAFYFKADTQPTIQGLECGFEQFFLEVTGDEFGDLIGLVTYEMDMVCECNFTNALHTSTVCVYLKDILDTTDCLEYSNVPVPRNCVDSRYKEVMFLEALSSHFTHQRLYQKAAHFIRCAIKQTLQAIRSSSEEIEQQSKSELREERIPHNEITLYNYALLRFYHDLYNAYKSMGQKELMQEYVEDYEAVCLASGYTYHYNRVANIWQKLGNHDRANSLRDQAKLIKLSKTCYPHVTHYSSLDDVD